ncbi:MAG: hypothetical protein LR017_01985 [Candidatus Pacebacteria bacterium]|nr:hypothetical protein [Candidatus Paceibacterota bacterium]
MQHKTTTLYREERTWFFAALVVLLMIFAAYIYFVSASVVHVVIRKEMNQEILKTSSYVSQLEAAYIEAQHAVSSDIASREGYQVVSEKMYINRADTTLVLGRATDG